MKPKTFRQYCKTRNRPLKKRPLYITFQSTWTPALLVGVCLGLVLGIWKNFFPLPEGIFKTVGAVMFTIVCCGAGATVGLITAPLYLAIGNCFILIRHRAKAHARRKRLENNPLIQEVTEICRQQNICAVIITKQGVRLYKHILDDRYCADERDIFASYSTAGFDEIEKSYERKDYWRIYDYGYVREILFASEGFEEMEDDLQMEFANLLRDSLSGWGAVSHYAYAYYTEVTGGNFNGTITFNGPTGRVIAHRSPAFASKVIRDLHRDYFVFDLQAAHAEYLRRTSEENTQAPQKW